MSSSTPSPPTPRTSGLAIATLIVGILALCGGLLAIPGILVGILAIRQVNRSSGRLTGLGLAWSGVGLSLIGILLGGLMSAVLYPVFVRAREAAVRQTCIAQAGQVATGVLIYAGDHDGGLPAADTWCDDLLPYVKRRGIFVCPGTPKTSSSFAYNRALAGHPLNEIPDPARTVLIYESKLGWNGAGGPETMASAFRAKPGYVIGFADGHATFVEPKDLPGLIWEPGASAPPR